MYSSENLIHKLIDVGFVKRRRESGGLKDWFGEKQKQTKKRIR